MLIPIVKQQKGAYYRETHEPIAELTGLSSEKGKKIRL